MSDAKVNGKPIVKTTTIINDTEEFGAEETATPFLLTPIFVFTLLLILIVVVSTLDWRRRKITPIVDTIFYSIIGLVGCLLTFLIFVSTHEATSPNYLYLWINPLCFIPAIFIWIKAAQKLVKCYQILNFALLLVFVVAWICGVQSFNLAILPILIANFIRSACFLLINRKTN
jgi:hypothetical protein